MNLYVELKCDELDVYFNDKVLDVLKVLNRRIKDDFNELIDKATQESYQNAIKLAYDGVPFGFAYRIWGLEKAMHAKELMSRGESVYKKL